MVLVVNFLKWSTSQKLFLRILYFKTVLFQQCMLKNWALHQTINLKNSNYRSFWPCVNTKFTFHSRPKIHCRRCWTVRRLPFVSDHHPGKLATELANRLQGLPVQRRGTNVIPSASQRAPYLFTMNLVIIWLTLGFFFGVFHEFGKKNLNKVPNY